MGASAKQILGGQRVITKILIAQRARTQRD